MAALVTLDGIVRNMLKRRNYPLHYYIDFLVYGKDILREIALDDIGIVNTKLLPVTGSTNNTGNYATLPNDYVDFVTVGVRSGQKVRPLVRDNKLNSLHNYDASFNIIDYTNIGNETDPPLVYGYLFPTFWNTVTWNTYGENIGRMFGWGAGNPADTFKIVPERNQIQINDGLITGDIILEYISDGQNADAASKITVYAYDTISNGIEWQFKENNRTYSDAQSERSRQIYLSSRKILRARNNGVTIEEVKRIAQKNYMAASRF